MEQESVLSCSASVMLILTLEEMHIWYLSDTSFLIFFVTMATQLVRSQTQFHCDFCCCCCCCFLFESLLHVYFIFFFQSLHEKKKSIKNVLKQQWGCTNKHWGNGGKKHSLRCCKSSVTSVNLQPQKPSAPSEMRCCIWFMLTKVSESAFCLCDDATLHHLLSVH